MCWFGLDDSMIIPSVVAVFVCATDGTRLCRSGRLLLGRKSLKSLLCREKCVCARDYFAMNKSFLP